jgi:hypothetical protein
MTRNRFATSLVALALTVLAGLVVRQGLLTASLTPAAQPVRVAQPATHDLNALTQYRASEWGETPTRAAWARVGVCAYFNQEMGSLHSVYVETMGITVARSANGVLGIDGGLMAIKDC